MQYLGTALWILLCVVCLPGESQSRSIDCEHKFVGTLIAAGYGKVGGGPTIDLLSNPLKVKYTDKSGIQRKAVVDVREHCAKPSILCEGESLNASGAILHGPLLHCSWKWEESDQEVNWVVVRLTHKAGEAPVASVSGEISRANEKVFPDSAEKGPLSFKDVLEDWMTEESGLFQGKRHAKRRADEGSGRYGELERDDESAFDRRESAVTTTKHPETTTKHPETTVPGHTSAATPGVQFTKFACVAWTIGAACLSLRMTN